MDHAINQQCMASVPKSSKRSHEEPGDVSTEAAHCFIDNECGRCTYFLEKL